MALDWLPTCPDAPRRKRIRQALSGGTVAFSETLIPPDILATLTFFPVAPASTPPHKHTACRMPSGQPVFTAATEPLSWLPTFPARQPRRHLDPALRQAYGTPPPGELVNTAKQLRWLPRFPDRAPRRRVAALGQSSQAPFVPPPTLVAGETCHVALIAQVTTAPTFLQETFTAPGLTPEAAASTTFLNERIC